ncbi:MAG TPA: SRPBCC family protein [Candidatus Limnocylindrales bacterium]|nr:SRPBCC family protein [Candidatus Limnocylindrales bacterium]
MPIERVWRLLTEPASYDTWIDGRVERVDPPGPAHPGQLVEVSSPAMGFRFRVRFRITAVDERNHAFEFDGRLPFGITMHERISVVALGPASTRVQYG